MWCCAFHWGRFSINSAALQLWKYIWKSIVTNFKCIYQRSAIWEAVIWYMETVARRCSAKKLFHKILKNSKERRNTPA